MNENVNPLSTAAVVVISSPKNTGIVPVPAAIPLPTIEPAFLFANTIVYINYNSQTQLFYISNGTNAAYSSNGINWTTYSNFPNNNIDPRIAHIF